MPGFLYRSSMTKIEAMTWDEKKKCDLVRERGYDRSDIPDDLTVKISKRITLDDEILELIWMIKKRNKGLQGVKTVVKAALRYYLRHQEKSSRNE